MLHLSSLPSGIILAQGVVFMSPGPCLRVLAAHVERGLGADPAAQRHECIRGAGRRLGIFAGAAPHAHRRTGRACC